MQLVVAYDITANKRRTKIAKILEDYGSRVNFSVFECDIGKTQYEEMKKRIWKVVNPRRDCIIFYCLCGSCRQRREAIGTLPEKDEVAPLVHL